VSYCRLLVGVALLSLGCAAADLGQDDPCCLTHAEIQALFAMSACIEEDDVPDCLKESSKYPPEKGIDPNRAEKYLFIKGQTVGLSKAAKETGKGEIVVDFRMVEKSEKKIQLICNGKKYKQNPIKAFRDQLTGKGEFMVLKMKYSHKDKTCELTSIAVVRLKKVDEPKK
jgi:hypothetical protein